MYGILQSPHAVFGDVLASLLLVGLDKLRKYIYLNSITVLDKDFLDKEPAFYKRILRAHGQAFNLVDFNER